MEPFESDTKEIFNELFNRKNVSSFNKFKVSLKLSIYSNNKSTVHIANITAILIKRFAFLRPNAYRKVPEYSTSTGVYQKIQFEVFRGRW